MNPQIPGSGILRNFVFELLNCLSTFFFTSGKPRPILACDWLRLLKMPEQCWTIFSTGFHETVVGDNRTICVIQRSAPQENKHECISKKLEHRNLYLLVYKKVNVFNSLEALKYFTPHVMIIEEMNINNIELSAVNEKTF